MTQLDPQAASISSSGAADQNAPADGGERLRDLSPQQWKSGLAAWLGWLFDGLDMHLYTLVATPFVAELLQVNDKDPSVDRYSSIIQAAFLVGWALGGGFFGRLGDILGRSRALVLTILTYALFTGLSYFATTWWHLMIYRFLAALGIGGEWAVGASLLSETWPRRWRPWLAAILQSAVNIGVICAAVFGYLMSDLAYRYVFLVGVLPAFVTLWIRRAVPETEEWHAARSRADHRTPGIGELFRGSVLRTTVLTILVCSLSLSAHWTFNFWWQRHLSNLMTSAEWSDPEKQRMKSVALTVIMTSAIIGNFVASAIARRLGYRRAIITTCLSYCAALWVAYSFPFGPSTMVFLLFPLMGVSSGVFGLFTMYLPPLFPTLLRTTGAGFCYNIGRIAAAAATIYFGVVATDFKDHGLGMRLAGLLFLPAAGVALMLHEPSDEVRPKH